MPIFDEYRSVLDYLKTTDPEDRARKKHRLPLESYSQSDCEYFFTICARGQGNPFTHHALARAIVDALLWRRNHHNWRLYCYCLMPDHLHFIVQLPDIEARLTNAGARGVVPYGILDHIADFKRYTTTQVWWKLGGRGALWQRSSYDRVLRYNESVDEAVQYVLNNPVAKGIVDRWEDYPYAAIVDTWS
jgi:REP element-mobilizing transposase RayT